MSVGETFPVYEAKRSESFPAFLIVYCPRDDCPGMLQDRPFLVAEHVWMNPQKLERLDSKGSPIVIVGRPCPYCWRPSHVPKRKDIG